MTCRPVIVDRTDETEFRKKAKYHTLVNEFGDEVVKAAGYVDVL
jgi:hypothetical protein